MPGWSVLRIHSGLRRTRATTSFWSAPDAARADYLVTGNERHFHSSGRIPRSSHPVSSSASWLHISFRKEINSLSDSITRFAPFSGSANSRTGSTGGRGGGSLRQHKQAGICDPDPSGNDDTFLGQASRSASTPTTEEILIANYRGDSIMAYAPGANGDASPAWLIGRRLTPMGLAKDTAGRIYVTNYWVDSLSIFASGATGAAQPVAVIRGSQAGLDSPAHIAVNRTARST